MDFLGYLFIAVVLMAGVLAYANCVLLFVVIAVTRSIDTWRRLSTLDQDDPTEIRRFCEDTKDLIVATAISGTTTLLTFLPAYGCYLVSCFLFAALFS